jgi:hypothetical protein
VSTQTGFDLTGLSRAIHARDCRYHLALYAADAQVEILDATQVTYTEECRYADGSNVLFEGNAQIRRGPITTATVRLINVPCEEPYPTLAQPGAARTPDAPRHALSPNTSPRRQDTTRNLAGKILG